MSAATLERLPFVLPDFTRYMWVSDAARQVWAPRLQAITRAWLDIEWRAVIAGVRACAVTTVAPEGLIDGASRWVDHGLAALPLEMQGAGGSYASTAVALEPGKPFVFRVIVGRLDDLTVFRGAWRASDDVTIGRLLGYPPCCTTFFRRVWVDDRMVDTTWPMAAASAAATNGVRALTVYGPPEANILWRWMGVRAVPHLPCRFDCAATVTLGERFVEVGREAGYHEELDWLHEVLRWPVEWSALHGIAEVRTPVLKVSARTDATPVKYVVRRTGDAYPLEGARGIDFPYQTPARPRLTASRGFRRGLAQTLPVVEIRPDWYSTDNGFPSVGAMDIAHTPVVALAVATLGAEGGAVLDLGCGNGALLGKLHAAAPAVVPFGIDQDPARIAHACTLLPQFAPHFWTGALSESEAPWADGRRYALALLMPGRLVEAGPEKAAGLRARLRAACDRILVYAYDDWQTRYGSLRGLVEAAGLRPVSNAGSVGLAEIL